MSKNSNISKIGFGGGCHWCTEAVFTSLMGVIDVKQGWIASSGQHQNLSEGVIVQFLHEIIDLKSLVSIHLFTHSSTSEHSLCHKYRSAIYTFSNKQAEHILSAINELQSNFERPIITKVLPLIQFKENEDRFQNYYFRNPDRQFCKT